MSSHSCFNAWRDESHTPDKIKFFVFSRLITCNTAVLPHSSTSPLQKIYILQVAEFISAAFCKKAKREFAVRLSPYKNERKKDGKRRREKPYGVRLSTH